VRALKPVTRSLIHIIKAIIAVQMGEGVVIEGVIHREQTVLLEQHRHRSPGAKWGRQGVVDLAFGRLGVLGAVRLVVLSPGLEQLFAVDAHKGGGMESRTNPQVGRGASNQPEFEIDPRARFAYLVIESQ